jgi:putative cell wall-binding protein
VALRRQVFESKASSESSSWRCSSDDKIREEKSLPATTRSLSAESVTESEPKLEKVHVASTKKERPKPVRENSYLTAVRSSPEVAPVVLRQKSQLNQRLQSEEDDRKTRRTSYLKATANEEFQFASDTDQNSVSMTPDDEEAQQLKR